MAEEDGMVPGNRGLPGTWLFTVTLNNQPFAKTVVTFTSDGGMVDRADRSPE
jgi:hypothetical protein